MVLKTWRNILSEKRRLKQVQTSGFTYMTSLIWNSGKSL
jgi:hypothetical protein